MSRLISSTLTSTSPIPTNSLFSPPHSLSGSGKQKFPTTSNLACPSLLSGNLLLSVNPERRSTEDNRSVRKPRRVLKAPVPKSNVARRRRRVTKSEAEVKDRSHVFVSSRLLEDSRTNGGGR